jgi:N-methylhydantoinase B
VHQYGLRPDSGGPGKFRGGCGVVFEFEVLAPDCVIIARGMERLRFQPWGLLGGCGGVNGQIEVKRTGADKFEVVSKADAIRATIGDVIRLSTAGGGGYGEAFERDPQRVLDDVLNGFVSIAGARSDYGVVINNGQLDSAATAKARQGHQPLVHAGLHTLGTAREKYEQVWTPAVAKALIDILFALPQPMRYEVRGRLWRAMEKRRNENQSTDTAALAALWVELKKHMEKSLMRMDAPKPQAKAA